MSRNSYVSQMPVCVNKLRTIYPLSLALLMDWNRQCCPGVRMASFRRTLQDALPVLSDGC
jgi:hypothetical protein